MRVETLEQIRKALAPTVAAYATSTVTTDIRVSPSKESFLVLASSLDKTIVLGFAIMANGLPSQTAFGELERSLSCLVNAVDREVTLLSTQSAGSVH